MTLDDALRRARVQSEIGRCAQHVNAICQHHTRSRITTENGKRVATLVVEDFTVSDFYDGSTVATFENGKEK